MNGFHLCLSKWMLNGCERDAKGTRKGRERDTKWTVDVRICLLLRCLGTRTVLQAVQIKEYIVLKTLTVLEPASLVRTAQNRVIIFMMLIRALTVVEFVAMTS